jgi:DNA-binding transcriptional MerR regulator
MLLKIKEFADFSNISVRALHLYDKLHLLTPAFIDTCNNYRYYDTDQVQELNTIISFKKIGFSLAEIKELKAVGYEKAEVTRKLEQKRLENEANIDILSYNNQNIIAMLKRLESEPLEQSPTEKAYQISKLCCLENEKLGFDFSRIFWL